MKEIWKDIPGWNGQYQCSNLGRVRSLPRQTVVKDILRRGHTDRHDEVWHRKMRILSPIYQINEHEFSCTYVRLYDDKHSPRIFAVKWLVAITWLDAPCYISNWKVKLKDRFKPCTVDNVYVKSL